MIGKLLRTGVLLLGLGSLTGCEGCEKKRSVPVTEGPAASPGAPLAAGERAAWPSPTA